jgi:hypothetical protein
MKQLAVRLTVVTSVCGGVIALAAQAAHARLAGNHCEPVVSVD